MKYLTIEFFNQFKCIGSDCPDTCCAGWGIRIDESSYKKYLSINTEFGEKLKNSIEKKDDKYLFRLNENLRCPFLNEKNLCDIYINIGEDAMCDVCRTYPRIRNCCENTEFISLSLSCPEVARMLVEKQEKIQFFLTEDDIIANPLSEIDIEYYNCYISAFITCINIMQNRSLNISQRLLLLILFNEEFKEAIDKGTNIKSVIKKYENMEEIAKNQIILSAFK